MFDQRLHQTLEMIHQALEHYLYPHCNKCHTSRVERGCRCDEKKEKG